MPAPSKHSSSAVDCPHLLYLTRSRELHSRLHHPDGICGCPGDDTCDGSGREVYIRVFLPVVEGVGDDLLAIAVREEVDRTGRDYAYECWGEAFEERTGRFFTVDVTAK